MKDRERTIKRLSKKIQNLLNRYRCCFLTLTFNDETLKSTNDETRERYIKKYLKEETAYYIANKDYGSEKKREHYHALIVICTLNDEEISPNQRDIKNQLNFKVYKYGQIKSDYIGTKYHFKGEKNNETTAHYLAEHFYKYSAKNNRVIFSREIQPKEKQKERLKRLYDEKQKAIKERLKEERDKEIINDALSDYYEFCKTYKGY